MDLAHPLARENAARKAKADDLPAFVPIARFLGG